MIPLYCYYEKYIQSKKKINFSELKKSFKLPDDNKQLELALLSNTDNNGNEEHVINLE